MAQGLKLGKGLVHNVCLIYGRHVNVMRRVNHANNVLMSRSYDAHSTQEDNGAQ